MAIRAVVKRASCEGIAKKKKRGKKSRIETKALEKIAGNRAQKSGYSTGMVKTVVAKGVDDEETILHTWSPSTEIREN